LKEIAGIRAGGEEGPSLSIFSWLNPKEGKGEEFRGPKGKRFASGEKNEGDKGADTRKGKLSQGKRGSVQS